VPGRSILSARFARKPPDRRAESKLLGLTALAHQVMQGAFAALAGWFVKSRSSWACATGRCEQLNVAWGSRILPFVHVSLQNVRFGLVVPFSLGRKRRGSFESVAPSLRNLRNNTNWLDQYREHSH